LVPSRTFDCYWILVWANGVKRDVGEHVGKWVITVDVPEVD
jgi:hypothetical protein